MADTSQKHILVVEDDETLSQSLVSALEDAKFRVSAEMDGEAGLQKAEADTPDLIILDVMMPKLDGISALKRLRTMDALAATPVIILTNREDIDVVGETLASGAHDFLVKHEWKLEDIVTLVKRRVGLEDTSATTATDEARV